MKVIFAATSTMILTLVLSLTVNRRTGLDILQPYVQNLNKGVVDAH